MILSPPQSRDCLAEGEEPVVPLAGVTVLSEIKSSPAGPVLTWETGAMGTIVSISQESGLIFFNQHLHA